MEAEEGPAGYHVHGHSGHVGDERIGMIKCSGLVLTQFLPEPVHHVCSVGFGDDLASEGKKLPFEILSKK